MNELMYGAFVLGGLIWLGAGVVTVLFLVGQDLLSSLRARGPKGVHWR